MDPILKKEKQPARRTSTSSGDVTATKKKSSRACAPCRKRKVKCNGEQPCERCSKTDTECIFDKQHQKRESPKSIADNHEPRLKKLEEFSVHFSRILEKSHVEGPFYYNQSQLQHTAQRGLTINTTGQGMYVPDSYLRTDRVPSIYKENMIDWNPIIQELLPNGIAGGFHASTNTEIRHNLLDIYFRFIDPLIPILHKPSFLATNANNDLLLNAIYCVSSRWDTTVSATGDQPRGWLYYQNAIKLIDISLPRLSTVQALFLLLKYNEHVRRPGFMWRTRFYFQMIVRMAKDLGLNHDILDTKPNLSIEIETRKRTFWAVFCYDVMMSIENGTVPSFSNTPLMLEAPTMLADEAATDYENMMHFILFTKVIRVQADTLGFLRDKFKPSSSSSSSNPTTATLTLETLSESLYSLINVMTSTCTPPQKENFSYSACFLYLASSFACILLHRPFIKEDKQALHQCIQAASKIKSIIQLVLECEGIENIYCSIRGIQQMVHYLSAAVTVFKMAEKPKEFQEMLYLTKQLASISPATEVMTDDIKQEDMMVENRPSEQSLKRKSLHLPENRAIRRNRLSMPIMDNAMQYPHFQYEEPTCFMEQYDTEMTNVHQQQSLLGLLFNDDESTMKDIPTL